ncbi:50S ribosomal protein L15 [Thiospirochaeta perfilievii]|uniref:Large ribosomal subunit protein uL15 n=1 Tax=Thiospirochaeta perfilievii TaxID=252967 RepID=A0A5C1QAU4_9SPIO|nr:50S ribosomal protein L15 [Thiospirochaeta perfilievii]QEN05175.1 50S ribosomal protein L15 [Thiospirochaeta perfilievii]
MSDFNLKAPKGANKNKKMLGRGRGTGLGKTSGRGNNGQNSRSGGGTKLGFEGGQMPLFRRIASRGFSNHPFKTEYQAVNLDQLEDRFNDGDKVNLETLVANGLIKRSEKLVKILAAGEITKKLEIESVKVSASAKEKIEKAGGKVL